VNFKQCCVCGLVLPTSVMQSIQVRHQGKIITIPICNTCKERKEKEAKENK